MANGMYEVLALIPESRRKARRKGDGHLYFGAIFGSLEIPVKIKVPVPLYVRLVALDEANTDPRVFLAR